MRNLSAPWKTRGRSRQGASPRGEIDAKPATKARTDKYALYLRLLDAEADSAPRLEIAQTLFASTADPSAAFENHRRAAHELRADGYRALAGTS